MLVAIFGSLRPDVFFLPRNLVNIGLAITILGILAVAETVVIVSGGLDVSVGSIVGLATMCAAMAMLRTDSAALGIGAALLAGALAGLVNGLIITFGRVNAVITTLGTHGRLPRPRLPHLRRQLGQHLERALPRARQRDAARPAGADLGPARRRGGLHVGLGATVVGRNIYAMGGNPTVARLAGIPIRRYQIGIYVMCGLSAGLAALMLAARTMSGQPASGSQGLELEAITAAILGGCALQGGKGTIVGAMLGVLIIGTLNNGMILTSVPTFYQLLAKGTLLILAVIVQEQQMRRTGEA